MIAARHWFSVSLSQICNFCNNSPGTLFSPHPTRPGLRESFAGEKRKVRSLHGALVSNICCVNETVLISTVLSCGFASANTIAL